MGDYVQCDVNAVAGAGDDDDDDGCECKEQKIDMKEISFL